MLMWVVSGVLNLYKVSVFTTMDRLASYVNVNELSFTSIC